MTVIDQQYFFAGENSQTICGLSIEKYGIAKRDLIGFHKENEPKSRHS